MTTMNSLRLTLADEAATHRLGRLLAGLSGTGDVIALEGDLGSGKTVLARAFIRSLAGEEEVPSPTFTLAQSYAYRGGTIWHFDLYRIDDPREAFELGLEEAFFEAVSLIEWPERLGRKVLPGERCLWLCLAPAAHEGGRIATLSFGPSWGERFARVGLIGRERAKTAVLAACGWAGLERRRLAGDASFRGYERLTGAGRRAMLMDAPPPSEDVRPFQFLAAHLRRLGYSAPEVLARDEEAGFLLLEDLGDDTFTRLLARGEDEEALYRLAVDVLIDLHRRGERAIPEGLGEYDDERLLNEAMLLTDWYVPAVTGRRLEAAAIDEYRALWRDLLPSMRAVPRGLVLRDFHVDNLMRLDRPGLAACGLLDFQDGVAGPVTYDLMSLLEDARRDVDPALARRMKERYLAAFPDLDGDVFAASFAAMAAQRHAKVIGIFARLARRDGKPVYLGHIPRVWRLLEGALAHPRLASLGRWLDRHLPPFARVEPAP